MWADTAGQLGYLVGDEDSEASGSCLEHLEGILVGAVIPKIDGDHVIAVCQAQSLQHVGQSPALAPIHLAHNHTSDILTVHKTPEDKQRCMNCT